LAGGLVTDANFSAVSCYFENNRLGNKADKLINKTENTEILQMIEYIDMTERLDKFNKEQEKSKAMKRKRPKQKRQKQNRPKRKQPKRKRPKQKKPNPIMIKKSVYLSKKNPIKTIQIIL